MADFIDLFEQHEDPALGTFVRMNSSWHYHATIDFPFQKVVPVIFSCRSPKTPFPESIKDNISYVGTNFSEWWNSFVAKFNERFGKSAGSLPGDLVIENLMVNLPKVLITQEVTWSISICLKRLGKMEAFFEGVGCRKIG